MALRLRFGHAPDQGPMRVIDDPALQLAGRRPNMLWHVVQGHGISGKPRSFNSIVNNKELQMLFRWSRAAKRWTPLLLVAAGFLGATGSAQAVLQARDLNNDTFTDAYYDTALNITWLKDANAAGMNRDWSSANSWAEGLVFAGYDDWRLARINGTGPIESRFDCSIASAAECAASGNELGYMYTFNIEGRGNRTAFDDSIQHEYWSGTQFTTGSRAWTFNFDYGFNNLVLEDFNSFGGLSAWAVRPGDVIAAVPEPETYAMLIAGLGLLGYAARRRKLKEAAATA